MTPWIVFALWAIGVAAAMAIEGHYDRKCDVCREQTDNRIGGHYYCIKHLFVGEQRLLK